MDHNQMRYTTYTSKHSDIIEQGIEPIQTFLTEESTQEKLNLLFCMDKYLDPWFGYNLPHFDEIIFLLEQHLFLQENDEVKEEIIQLLCMYSLQNLDYIAEHINKIDPKWLSETVYALGLTYNPKYIPVILPYTLDDNPAVQQSAAEALRQLEQVKN